MHWFSIITVLVLLVGVWVVETRKTILCVFLPLLSVAWAAAMVRFDFFIHRQAAYLRELEPQLIGKDGSIPLWETWKVPLRSTLVIVPVADLIAFTVIFAPTIFMLFGPAQQFFHSRQWKGGKLYAWTVSLLLFLLLCSLALIPKIAGWRY